MGIGIQFNVHAFVCKTWLNIHVHTFFLVTQLHEFYLHVIGKTYMYTVSVYVYALSFLATFFNPSEFLRILKFEGVVS